ncbi:hypothetical protein [Haloechinothrix salitolerans]|uniref:Transmembrane protein n=1 Tax=Haloechinothrix salitolerans TaxID=926830 RepID=A0ABW2C2F4_9PSEU
MFGTTSSSALWSALQPGGNPLIRPSDRRQARLAAVLIALALLSGPLMAAYGFSYHASLTDRAAAQQHDRYRVDAIVTEDAPVTERNGAMAFQMPRQATALAEWSTPDGKRHEGTVPVAGGASAGDTITIWVDGDGDRTTAPLSPGQTVTAAVLATIGTWLLFVAALAGIYVLMRVRLDRERYAAWEREWREFDEHRT